MASWRPIQPERVFMVLALASGLTTWTLFGIGFFLGQPSVYRWAWIALAITLLIGFTPLLAFAIGLVIEKFRGSHHD